MTSDGRHLPERRAIIVVVVRGPPRSTDASVVENSSRLAYRLDRWDRRTVVTGYCSRWFRPYTSYNDPLAAVGGSAVDPIPTMPRADDDSVGLSVPDGKKTNEITRNIGERAPPLTRRLFTVSTRHGSGPRTK